MVIIVATTTEEIKEAFVWLTENTGANAIVKAAEIQKQKKADYDKKRYEEKKNSTVKNVSSDKEKREEKEGILPLDSPSSLPSFPPDPLINYPITPFNPPLPEEKGERKESFLAVETKNGEQQRRVTEPFGNYVRLTPEEYGKLCEKFGNEKADEMIQRMDNYIGEDPKRQKKYESRNHYLTLLNWERMDQERKTQPLMKQKPQQKSWLEVAREIDAEERGEVIDL